MIILKKTVSLILACLYVALCLSSCAQPGAMTEHGEKDAVAGQSEAPSSGYPEESGRIPEFWDTAPDERGEGETEETDAGVSAPDTSAETAGPVTEPVTEPATGPVTDPVTDPVTEPVTEPVTDPATEPATEPVTDPVTEPVTEPETGEITDQVTEPHSDAPGTDQPEPPQSPVLLAGETLVESRDYTVNEGKTNEAVIRISIVEKSGIYGGRRAMIELLDRKGNLLDSPRERVSGIAFICMYKNPGGYDSIAVFIANPKTPDSPTSASFIYYVLAVSDIDFLGTPLPGLRLQKAPDPDMKDSVGVVFGTPADEKGFNLKYKAFMEHMKYAWENYYGSDVVCRLDQGGWNLYGRGQEPLRKEAVEAITGMDISELKYWF